MNFALILFVLVVITGVAWLADKLYFIKQRRQQASLVLETFDKELQNHSASRSGDAFIENLAVRYPFDPKLIKNTVTDNDKLQKIRAQIKAYYLRQPLWLEYTASLFPVIAAVFFLRSFIVEPFKIPSGSMMPTLLVGDFILVNKYTYGIRLPVINKKIIDINKPQRGDVMVFRYPRDPSLDYIKRVIGLPGDTIVYTNKQLFINGEAAVYKQLPDYLDEERLGYSQQFTEQIGSMSHRILNDPDRFIPLFDTGDFPTKNLCAYTNTSVRCTVPPGHYFMMGDNRDHSSDSRVWGFVPEENIVGRAFFVWMNIKDIKRIGSFQ